MKRLLLALLMVAGLFVAMPSPASADGSYLVQLSGSRPYFTNVNHFYLRSNVRQAEVYGGEHIWRQCVRGFIQRRWIEEKTFWPDEVHWVTVATGAWQCVGGVATSVSWYVDGHCYSGAYRYYRTRVEGTVNGGESHGWWNGSTVGRYCYIRTP